MSESSSAGAPTPPWARLQVLRGERPRKVLFAANVPARVVIGSLPSEADFLLQAPDVAPRQLDIMWDGRNLWLEDALRLGRTFVNGRLLNEWIAVVGQVVVSFGAVRLWIVGRGSQPERQSPDFAAFEHACVAVPQPDVERRRDTQRITWPPELEQWKDSDGIP